MLTYKDAGVDTQEGQRAVQLMKTHVEKTFSPNVLTGLGSFGGLYSLGKLTMDEPVLVAGTDGVGTKLKIAFMMNKHDTVGQDLVAMCVNDILCQGAMPLFFLDYIATGKVVAEEIAVLVSGIAQACEKSSLSLIGGETAEMPNFYQEGEYDMAGFAVGMVDKKNIVDGSAVKEGDVVIGLSSSGVHSNGFSFVRKLFFEKMGYTVDTQVEELGGTLGEALLTPTKLYVKPVMELMKKVEIHGMIHVTGGGFYENVPRILQDGLSIHIDTSKITPLPIFEYIKKMGNISETELYSSFNMGIGFMLVLDESQAENALSILKNNGEEGKIIGKVTKGTEKVVLT